MYSTLNMRHKNKTASLFLKSLSLTTLSLGTMIGYWYWREHSTWNQASKELDALHRDVIIKESWLSNHAQNEFSQKNELVQKRNVLNYILRQCRLSFWIPLENVYNNTEAKSFGNGYLAPFNQAFIDIDQMHQHPVQLVYFPNIDLLSNLAISLRNYVPIVNYNDLVKLLFTPKPAIINICYIEGESEEEFLNRLCDSFHLSKIFAKRFQDPLYDTLNWIIDVLKTAHSEIELSNTFQFQSNLLNQFKYSNHHTIHLLLEWRKSDTSLATNDRLKWIKIFGNVVNRISGFSRVTFCYTNSDDIDSRSFLENTSIIWADMLGYKGNIKALDTNTNNSTPLHSIASMIKHERDKLMLRFWQICK